MTSNAFNKGYEQGNYAGAYVAVYDIVNSEGLAPLDAVDYTAGYTLGFFSSYETSEIPEDMQHEVAQLRLIYGDAS